MATWESFVDHVRRTYLIDDEAPDSLQLVLTTTADRSQAVLIQRVAPEGGVGEWVRIDSVVGLLEELDPVEVMRAAAETGFGGLVVIDDEVVLRHLLPLQSPFLGELDRPIHLAVRTADRLERQFSGRDRH